MTNVRLGDTITLSLIWRRCKNARAGFVATPFPPIALRPSLPFPLPLPSPPPSMNKWYIRLFVDRHPNGKTSSTTLILFPQPSPPFSTPAIQLLLTSPGVLVLLALLLSDVNPAILHNFGHYSRRAEITAPHFGKLSWSLRRHDSDEGDRNASVLNYRYRE